MASMCYIKSFQPRCLTTVICNASNLLLAWQWSNLKMIYFLEYIKNKNNKNQMTWLKNEQKTWIDISPKTIHKWSISTWKNVQHYKSLGKCKSKPQWDRYNFTPTRMTTISKKRENNNFWQGCTEIGTLVLCLWEYKNGVAMVGNSMTVHQKS